MRDYARDQRGLSDDELEEPPPEHFRVLFLGEPGETAAECGARVAVADEVLAELRDQAPADPVARENVRYAEALSRLGPLGCGISAPGTAAHLRRPA